MDIDLSKRGVLTMFFRRRFTFLFIYAVTIACAAAYIHLATPLYSASGSLLVKFGANATPDGNITERFRNICFRRRKESCVIVP